MVGLDEGLLVGVGAVGAAAAVGFMVGFPEGAGTGTFEGNSVGELVGTSVGELVGTSVGTDVGGRVYSTTIVDVVAPALVVAFLFSVMFTPVTFAFAVSLARWVDMLPLDTADDICDEKLLVMFASLPLNVDKRRPSSPCERATKRSRRISRRKCTSTSVTEDEPTVVTFSACTFVISSVVVTNDMTRTRTFLMTDAMLSVNVLGVNPPSRMDDSRCTNWYGANVGCCVGFKDGIGVGSNVGADVGDSQLYEYE